MSLRSTICSLRWLRPNCRFATTTLKGVAHELYVSPVDIASFSINILQEQVEGRASTLVSSPYLTCPTCELYPLGTCRNGEVCRFHICRCFDFAIGHRTASHVYPCPDSTGDQISRKIAGKIVTFGPGMEVLRICDEWEGSVLYVRSLPGNATIDSRAVRHFLESRRFSDEIGNPRILKITSLWYGLCRGRTRESDVCYKGFSRD